MFSSDNSKKRYQKFPVYVINISIIIESRVPKIRNFFLHLHKHFLQLHSNSIVKFFPTPPRLKLPQTQLKLHYYFSKLRPILLIKISSYRSVMQVIYWITHQIFLCYRMRLSSVLILFLKSLFNNNYCD